MRKYSLLSVFWILIFNTNNCIAQIETMLELNIDLNGTDNAEDMIEIDGFIYTCGYSDFGLGSKNYIAISKIDSLGNRIWEKRFGSSLDDKALGMAKTWDKHLIICGQSETSPSEIDAMLAKIDTLGNLKWLKTFTAQGTQVVDNIIETIDSNYVFCGSYATLSSLNEAYIAKTDTAGNLLWEQFIGDVGNEYASGITQSPFSQSFFLSYDTNSFTDNYDVALAKINNSNGAIEWSTSYQYPFSAGAQNIIFTTDNNLLIVGETVVSSLTPNFDNYIQKTDTNGVSIWQKNIGKSGTEATFSVLEKNNKFYLTGYSSSNANFTNNGYDLVVTCIDTSGNFKWEYFYGSTGIEIGRKIIVDNNNNFWACSKNNSTNNFYLIKFKEDLLFSVNEISYELKNELIYPNPCTNKLLITSFKNKPTNYKITNYLGTEIETGITTNGEINISTEYKNGMYFLHFTTENKQTFCKKFVVEKY